MTIDWAEAVRQKQRINLNYDPGERLVEPHAFGLTKDGNYVVRAYQTQGASKRGEHHDWKFFRVDRMTNAAPSGEHFGGPRPGYKRGDRAMKGGIIAEL